MSHWVAEYLRTRWIPADYAHRAVVLSCNRHHLHHTCHHHDKLSYPDHANPQNLGHDYNHQRFPLDSLHHHYLQLGNHPHYHLHLHPQSHCLHWKPWSSHGSESSPSQLRYLCHCLRYFDGLAFFRLLLLHHVSSGSYLLDHHFSDAHLHLHLVLVLGHHPSP